MVAGSSEKTKGNKLGRCQVQIVCGALKASECPQGIEYTYRKDVPGTSPRIPMLGSWEGVGVPSVETEREWRCDRRTLEGCLLKAKGRKERVIRSYVKRFSQVKQEEY